jgi:hypothetical protein
MAADRLLWTLRDDKDRRSGLDRRIFSYSCHIPERRQGEGDQEGNKGRRCGLDRRINGSL